MSLQRNLATAGFLLAALAAPVAQAAMTPANTAITNTAYMTYTDPDGNPNPPGPGGIPEQPSNTTTVRVAELLDVTVTSNDVGNEKRVASGDTNAFLTFTVTNQGNGSEAYALSTNAAITTEQFDPTNVRIYIDNGDGVFDPATDTLYTQGTTPDPVLAASGNTGDSIRVFVVSDIPGALADGDLGQVALFAESKTAQSTPTLADPAGTVFAGLGTGGVDAVAGNSNGVYDSDTAGYRVRDFALNLVKTQSILDPFGGNKAVPGAVITYTLTLNATGAGAFDNLLITDNVPANTTYVSGSLTAGGGVVTDGQDNDAGYVQGGVVRFCPNGNVNNVASCTITAPNTYVMTFRVTIDHQ